MIARRLIRCWRGRRRDGRAGWAELAAATRASSVVVRLLVGQDEPQMSFAKISIRSVASVPAVSTNLSAYAFARRRKAGRRARSMSARRCTRRPRGSGAADTRAMASLTESEAGA
jgi:hypothetical protein